MPLANCPRCGNLFNKLTSDICNQCREEEDQLLKETQEYLRKNRNASKAQVISDLDLSTEMMDNWIRSKRIHFFQEEELRSKRYCSSCGREIKENQTICRTCQLKKLSSKEKKPKILEKEKTKTEEQPPEPSKGMHFKKKP